MYFVHSNPCASGWPTESILGADLGVSTATGGGAVATGGGGGGGAVATGGGGGGGAVATGGGGGGAVATDGGGAVDICCTFPRLSNPGGPPLPRRDAMTNTSAIIAIVIIAIKPIRSVELKPDSDSESKLSDCWSLLSITGHPCNHATPDSSGQSSRLSFIPSPSESL